MKIRLVHVAALLWLVLSLIVPGFSILGQDSALQESEKQRSLSLSCTELITNTSFETQEGWQLGVTPRTAQYVTDEAQHGSWSVLMGIRPPTADTYSHSSVYQLIHVPADAAWVQLGFWYKPFTEESPWQAPKDVSWEGYEPSCDGVTSGQAEAADEDRLEAGIWSAYDWQECLILSPSYGLLEVVMRQCSNRGTWGYWTHDLSAYRGQDIVIYFNVYNNGWGGRRTWMYLDDVSVLSCDGTVTLTPTPTSTPWDCLEIIQNGSFETQTDWQRGITPRTARYADDDAHSGTWSMLLGIRSGEPDITSYSSAYQLIHVPADAAWARLDFWYKPFTEETPWSAPEGVSWEGYEPAIAGIKSRPPDEIPVSHDPANWSAYDWQECWILDAQYRLVAQVMRRCSNAQTWQHWTYDLTPYRGQDIVIYFNVYNNGWGGRRTWMYLDDVSVTACSYAVTPTPTPTQPTATPTPTQPTATPTATITPSVTPTPWLCTELVGNGSFEGNTDWYIGLTPRQAMYVADTSHWGARSMLMGIRPPVSDIYSYSSTYQHIYIPPDATSVRLSFWYKPFTEEYVVANPKEVDWSGYDPLRIVRGEMPERSNERDPNSWYYYDWQECLILDPSYRVLEVVMRTCSNAQTWQYFYHDLSAYRGQHIVLYFNVYNDGVGGLRTWMYLDDVSMEACGQSYGRWFCLPLMMKYWPTLPPATPTPPTYPYPSP